ncbi:MAG: HAMP domain-containing sensor histidine kinase [Eubacteriales bacterium]|nr:HAMP domain-containing sensor histidine kinase [Eubacteriales bacterium]
MLDTKSRKYSWQYHVAFKLLAVALCVAGAVVAALQLGGMLTGTTGIWQPEMLLAPEDYAQSNEYRWQGEGLYRALETRERLQSEDAIASGQSSIQRFTEEKTAAQSVLTNQLDQAQAYLDEQLAMLETYDDEYQEATQLRINQAQQEYENQAAALNLEYEQDMAALRQRLIAEDMQEYGGALTSLADFEQQGWRYAVCRVQIVPDGVEAWASRQPEVANAAQRRTFTLSNGTYAVLGMEQGAYEQAAQAYASQRDAMLSNARALSVAGLFCLAGVAWLAYAAGRRVDQDGVVLTLWDKPYQDVMLALTVLVNLLGIAGVAGLSWRIQSGGVSPGVLRGLCVALSAAVVLWDVWAWTALCKRVKRGELLRHTLVVQSVCWAIRMVKRLAGYTRSHWQSVLVIGGYTLITAFMGTLLAAWTPVTVILCALGNGALIGMVWLYKNHQMAQLVAASQGLRQGTPLQSLSTGDKLMDEVGRNMGLMSQGLRQAVEREVKAERLRTELVTNVSHDLKTPLTSILTYVDLLKREGLQSDQAPAYLDVLDQKSQRLKQMTEDLFEAAKATTGNLPCEMARVDVAALISQGMGELDDKIAQSGLEFRLKLPAEPLYALADGKLLWRVMENLFSNAFKYTQPNTRVYLSALRRGGDVVIEMKNISALPLDMPPDELMERFTRGDAARASEGSGLGLSIVSSLTQLQQGRFVLDIDGDLFKAQVWLKAYADAAEQRP